MDLSQLRDALTDPSDAMTRSEALAAGSRLPKSGIYSWWFTGLDQLVPHDDVVRQGDWAMLYIGISPGRSWSRSNLRARLTQHLNLNAKGSTLRLTLGVLLAEELGLELRRVGSGKRLTFHCGESRLNSWLDVHARVKVVALDEPWILEPEVITGSWLPLNLDHNTHPFGRALSSMRAAARQRARTLPPNPVCCDK